MNVVQAGLGALLLLVAGRAHAQRVDAAAEAPPDEARPVPELPTEDRQAPTVAAADPLTDAELEELGVDLAQEGIDTDLHFSGFMDVNVVGQLNTQEAPLNTLAHGDSSTIFIGRLNLYATKNITDYFSMMAELRVVYSPNGSQLSGVADGVSTTYTQVLDYTGSGAQMRWGGILVERAYGQWSPSSLFALRIGSFLTPYGIWNVDHGSPVFIPCVRPYAVSGNLFPERQTGAEAFGRLALSTELSVRYHLTLSNGLGPVSEYRDLDNNKAVGGRLAFEWLKLGTIQIGGSAFYGKNTGGNFGFGISDDGTAITLEKSISEQSYVTALAADIMWKYRGFHFQGEWVGTRSQYTKVGRTRTLTAGQVGIPVNALSPDAFNWAGYALAGYRLPWWGIMPFATLEYQRTNIYGIDTETSFSKVGVNIRPTGPIVFKAEYEFALGGTAGTQVKILAAQLAWAF